MFVVFESGESWTHAELRERVRIEASSLASLGVRQDDFVRSWLPNGPDALAVWIALNYLGAVLSR